MRGEQLNVEDGTKVKYSCYGDVRYIYDDEYAKKVEELWDEWYRDQIRPSKFGGSFNVFVSFGICLLLTFGLNFKCR